MPDNTPPNYLLFIDGNLIKQTYDLVEAKAVGEEQSKPDNAVHIERLSGCVPSIGWKYDGENKEWVSISLPMDNEES